MLSLIFLIVALVLFILAAVPMAVGRINPTAAGLACWVASVLLARMGW